MTARRLSFGRLGAGPAAVVEVVVVGDVVSVVVVIVLMVSAIFGVMFMVNVANIIVIGIGCLFIRVVRRSPIRWRCGRSRMTFFGRRTERPLPSLCWWEETVVEDTDGNECVC